MVSQQEYYSEFGYYVHQIVSLLDKKGDKLFRSKLGISLTQFMLLRIIEASADSPLSQQALANRLNIAKSAVSRHVYIARSKGWLEANTSEHSRRENTLHLTDSGKNLLIAARKLIAQSEQAGFDDMPPQDIEATLRTLKNLYQKLQSDGNSLR